MSFDFDLLWYDDSPTRSDLEKVERAAARYEQKFGQPPTVCFVHPATSGLEYLQKTAFKQLGINVYTRQGRVPAPYHFRVGRNGDDKKSKGNGHTHTPGSSQVHKGAPGNG